MILQDLLIETKRKIEEVSNGKGFSGIPSGFDKLDKLTNGWQDSELIVIGGRPGMGKSSFAISMCRNMAVNFDINTLFFSIESTSYKIMSKLFALETGISSEKLRAGRLEKHEWELLNVKTKPLEKSPLIIDDTPSISIECLEEKIKSNVLYNNTEIVLIDYLQLITIDDKNVIATNREQCISIIIKKLKSLSKELSIPIILLSQLNRNLEERGGYKRPLLTDLRDSGTIAEDSDLVFFLYRPEYYKIDEWDDEYRSPTEDQAELILAKNRNGGLDNIRLKFNSYINKFDNLDDNDIPFDFVSKMNAAANGDNSFPSLEQEDDNVPF